MQHNYKYTAADFERYHSGGMSDVEMHAMEKAALQDPFLAEALEGYMYTDTPVKDIDELKEKLLQKKKKKNVFLVIQKQNVWLSIAAMFILIAGIGYFAYQLNFKKENTTLAKKEGGRHLKNDTQQIITSKTDSINTENDVAIAPDKTTETIKKENKKNESDNKISRENASEITSDDLLKKNVQTTPGPDAKRDYFITPEKNLMKGQVVDSLGRPVQYAILKDKNAKTIISTDSAGRFKMKANDSSLTANISAPGYKTEEKILSDKKEQVIVMQHDSRDLNEVVVIGNGAKRKKESLSNSSILQGKVPGVIVSDSNPQPIVGRQEFDQYVKKNIKIPVDNEGKNYSGKVTLSFEINKRGNAKKIKVEQSLCKPCDEEATRLILHGPKWKYINSERQKVTIEF